MYQVSAVVISVSRRTDIPGYYGEWFINRVREGFCEVRNPYNRSLFSRVSLLPGDADLLVFWTRNAAPFMHHLPELNEKGFLYYFLYTLVNYPDSYEPGTADLEKKLQRFIDLSSVIGREKVIWRYDPIILSSLTGLKFHSAMFKRIADRLKGYTNRVVISFLDRYKKVKSRLDLEKESAEMVDSSGFSDMMDGIRETAHAAGMEIQSCGEKLDLSRWNIKRGKCIDDELAGRVFGLTLKSRKDPGQRKLCRCIPSRDIGAYDTCPNGCIYCYASRSDGRGKGKYGSHDPEQTFL